MPLEINRKMIQHKVSIPCGTILLEGVLEAPASSEKQLTGAVVCHPHPLYGGEMNNNVTRAVAAALVERGAVCLRFNFRGTGRSQGVHGNGIDEMDDVRAALDFLQARPEVDQSGIILAGYSFGCWVALRAAREDPRPHRLIGVSPPVDQYDFSFLKDEKRPLLLIAGDRDFVCSTKGFRELVDSISGPVTGTILPGADHFHFGREMELIRAAHQFLDKHPLG